MANLRHGFYRKNLDKEEAALVSALQVAFKAKYPLDSLADDLLLRQALLNFVKSLRREPVAHDHNVRDHQARHEHTFREALHALALDRRTRRDDNGSREANEAHDAFARGSIERKGGSDGRWRPICPACAAKRPSDVGGSGGRSHSRAHA
jgi:hypothetical protein